MASLFPFRALRPAPAGAARVASVPYDVVSRDEARALAGGNPSSFLHVSRAEIDLPPEVDPHDESVYVAAARRFDRLKQEAPLEREASPALYLYRMRMGAHEQVGVAGCYALDEYDDDLIRKHEHTRPDKEDDRTRHMLALGAQTGPVFLTYRASSEVDQVVADAAGQSPLFDFEAPDGVRHTVWRVASTAAHALVSAFGRVPALYIADGHHRAASAARARQTLRARLPSDRDPAETQPCDLLLAVAFPDNQVQILAYNRTVKDLGGLSVEAFLERVRSRFDLSAGPPSPAVRGDISMYLRNQWHTLRRTSAAGSSDGVIASLDVSVLQEQVLDPVLGIRDVRTDPRIEFVGGARGPAALQRAVDEGRADVAFSMFPVSVSELIEVSDAGEIMPPKSTWFEPKLRDGLLIHEI